MIPGQDEPAESGRFICGKTGLRTLLLDNTKAKSGILLKFVEPKDDHNEVVRCTWSANVVFISKRICKANITLWKSAPPSARALTYESGGAERSAPETSVLSHYLTVEMSRLSEMIVQHCAHVSGGAVLISTITTHWKIDKNDRLVFLWASGLSLRGHVSNIPKSLLTVLNNQQRKVSSAPLQRKEKGASGAASTAVKLLMAPPSPIRPNNDSEKVPSRYTLAYDEDEEEKDEEERRNIEFSQQDFVQSDVSQSSLGVGRTRPKRAAQSAPGGRFGMNNAMHLGEGSTTDEFNIDDDLEQLIDKDDDDDDEDEDNVVLGGNKKSHRKWSRKGGVLERGSSAPIVRIDPSISDFVAPRTISETVKEVIKRAQSASVTVRPLSSPTSRNSNSSTARTGTVESSLSPRLSSVHSKSTLRPKSAITDIVDKKINETEDIMTIQEPDVHSWRPIPSNMKTPAFSRILPLIGPKAHTQALAQGEVERSSISVGRSVAHDPLWECPSCGTGSTASELASVSTLDVMRHYSTLLSSLHLQPRESQKLPNGARRRSDALDDCCYWPVDAAHVASVAGGVGVYFAYVMPQGATRVVANEPYSTPYYIDKWLYQREERIHPSLPTLKVQEDDKIGNITKTSTSKVILDSKDNLLDAQSLNVDPFTLKQARRKRVDIQMMVAEEEENRAKSYKPVFSDTFEDISLSQPSKPISPVKIMTSLIKLDDSEKSNKTVNTTRDNEVEEFSSVLLGLSPQGRAIVRTLSPTLARCFPSLSPSQIQLMQHGKPVEVPLGPVASGLGTSISVTSVPVCSDCYCAYRAFADTLLSGQQPQQALEITSARFMRINGKVALRTEIMAESAGTLSQIQIVKKAPIRTVMSAAQERQHQHKLEKDSQKESHHTRHTRNSGNKSARSTRSSSRSAKSRVSDTHEQDQPSSNAKIDDTFHDDDIEREERKLRQARSALQEAQQMVAKLQAEKEATRLSQKELLLKAEAFVQRQEMQKEMFRAASEIRKRTATLEAGGSGGNGGSRSRPVSAKGQLVTTSRPNSGSKRSNQSSKAPSRSGSAKTRQQEQQQKQLEQHHHVATSENVDGPDGDDIFSSTTDFKKISSDSVDLNSNHPTTTITTTTVNTRPPRPMSAFATMSTASTSILPTVPLTRPISRPISARSSDNNTTSENIAVYEFMSGEASSSQLQLMQPSMASIASNDSQDSFSTPFAPMIQNSHTLSTSSVVSSTLTPSITIGVPPLSLRPQSASSLLNVRSGAMLAGADWMDFYRKELNSRLGHLAPKSSSIVENVNDSSMMSIGSTESKTSTDMFLPSLQPQPPVSSLAASPSPSSSQQQVQQMPFVFENAIKSFRDSLKIIGESSRPPPYTPLSSTLGLLTLASSSSSVISTTQEKEIQQPSCPPPVDAGTSNKSSRSSSSRPSSTEYKQPFSTLTGPASISSMRKELHATDNRGRPLSANNIDSENEKPRPISDAAYQRLLGDVTVRAAAEARGII